MKKVLIFAHNFPGNGARGLGLLNRLPDYGVEVTIITNRNPEMNYSKVKSMVNRAIKVIETPCMNKSPFRIFSRVFGSWKTTVFFENLFFVPDTNLVWTLFAYQKACNLLDAGSYDAVMTISPPESIHLAGLWLKRKFGIRWIANFEDLWSSREQVFQPPTRYHRRLHLKLENMVYRECDGLIANTRGNEEIYVKEFKIPRKKISTITLGYESDECESALKKGDHSARDKVFRIGYMGALDKGPYPYESFLTALENEIKLNPTSLLEFRLCGYASEKALKRIKGSTLASVVKYSGMLPHPEAMIQMAGCDVLLVLLHETQHSVAQVPHKLYHYLGLKKPILAIAPESGEVSRILKETRAGEVISSKRAMAIQDWLTHRVLEKQRTGNISFHPKHDAMEQYEFDELVRRLYRALFNQVTLSEFPILQNHPLAPCAA